MSDYSPEQRRQVYLKRKSSGLCQDCELPAVKHLRCIKHYRAQKGNHRRLQRKRQNAGQCVDCGKTRNGDSKRWCNFHAVVHREACLKHLGRAGRV